MTTARAEAHGPEAQGIDGATSAGVAPRRRAGAKRGKGATSRKRAGWRDRSGYWFVLPFVVAGVLFLVWPTVYGLWMSFTGSSLTGSHGGFVGLDNYAEAFGDPQMWQALWQTVLFTLLSTIPLVVVGLVMALLVNAGLPGQWLWRTSFFASYLLPSAVVASVFLWILQPDIGLVNTWMEKFGLHPVGWLTDERLALMSIALVTLWWTVGFNFLLYLAALQGIPATLYEAALLDGAGAWRRLFSVTLPQLKSVTGVIVVLQLLASMKVFDQIYLMTAGGPNGSTRPILEYIYDVGFTNYRLGYASAISYVFFALILIFTLLRLVPGRKER
ncbi:MAG: carbohydrate ABC transporter permease [Galactobacter sp.]|uniref:carbohydrate ABC transporter permease n=1 Tax=Galactobacter sp. TaxID=2676125 RepID=UPI0025B942D7|nr:sugar ABC transporter permease [Galactobacter sp.]